MKKNKNMKQKFELRDGEIIFENDVIFISDKAKMHKYLTLISSAVWVLVGVKNAMVFDRPTVETIDYFWIVLGVIYLLLFIVYLRRSTVNLIMLNDVKSIKLKQRLSNTYLDIKLKNNRVRRVIQFDEPEELKIFIQKNYPPLPC